MRCHLHVCRGERNDFLVHTVCNSREHRRAAGQDNITVEVTADINVALMDGIVAAKCINTGGGGEGAPYAHSLVDATGFEAEHAGLEEDFGSTEARATSAVLSSKASKSLTARCRC